MSKAKTEYLQSIFAIFENILGSINLPIIDEINQYNWNQIRFTFLKWSEDF